MPVSLPDHEVTRSRGRLVVRPSGHAATRPRAIPELNRIVESLKNGPTEQFGRAAFVLRNGLLGVLQRVIRHVRAVGRGASALSIHVGVAREQTVVLFQSG